MQRSIQIIDRLKQREHVRVFFLRLKEEDVMQREIELVDRTLKGKVDSSHGLEHALLVLEHVDRALEVTDLILSVEQKEAVRLAALLHDVDDRKYFPQNQHYENARAIMSERPENIREIALRMIDLVSCTKNGNSKVAREWNGLPAFVIDETTEWMLYPRYADRLEAMGMMGIYRTWLYNHHVNRPDFTPQTPRARTVDELYAIASKERFEHYLKVGGKVGQSSLIDHYYDKLLHISDLGNNPYLKEEARKRHQITEEFLLEFGRTGTIDHIKWGLIE